MAYGNLPDQKLRKRIKELTECGFTDDTNSELNALSAEQAKRLFKGVPPLVTFRTSVVGCPNDCLSDDYI